MFESSYLIDPGSHTLRLYDPKTQSVHSIPACVLASGKAAGQEALQEAWNENERLLWPFSKETVAPEAAPLLQKLFSEAPPERFYLVPNGKILSFQMPAPQTEALWQQLLDPFHLGNVEIVPAFIPQDEEAFFHIHAGHSLIHLIMGTGQEVLAYKTLSSAGQAVDQAIVDEIARVFKILITPEDACALKEAASKALGQGRNPRLEVTGLSQRSTYERVSFRALDLLGCMETVLLQTARSAAEFVCSQGADLMNDVLSHPVRLSGGLAACYGLDLLLERTLHASVETVENPETWVLDTLCQYRPSRLRPKKKRSSFNEVLKGRKGSAPKPE